MQWAVLLVTYILVLSTSGWVVKYALQFVAHKSIEAVATEEGGEASETLQKRLQIGAIIGKCENILVLSFLLLSAYTTLALVVTAKTIVRKEEIEKNSMYFLAGTLVKVAYSVAVGFVLKVWALEYDWTLILSLK